MVLHSLCIQRYNLSYEMLLYVLIESMISNLQCKTSVSPCSLVSALHAFAEQQNVFTLPVDVL